MDRSGNRPGAIVLETIIGLPILMIVILAIVEFGLLSKNQAVIQAASRAGADASVGIASTLPPGGTVPSEVSDAVNAVLSARGISATCIRVEHTSGPAPPYVLVTGSGAASPIATRPSDDFVCVSVCVENTELAPNLLQLFHIDLAGKFSQHTTCRCLPLPVAQNPPDPNPDPEPEPEPTDLIQDIIDLLAATNLCPNAQGDINQAINELVKAQEELADDDLEKALDKMKKSVKEMVDAQSRCGGDEDILATIVQTVELARDMADQAIQDAIAVLGSTHPDVIAALTRFDQGLVEYARGNYEEAVDEFKKAVGELP